MTASICLLLCTFTLGQVTDRAEWQLAPQLTPGLELVYQGIYLEEKLIPNVQYQQRYHLEARMLVLDAKARGWPVALMTALSLQDGHNANTKKKDGPTSVRLELANVDLQGRIRNGEKKLLDIPIDGPPTLESGFLVPAPFAKVSRNFVWEVTEPGRPTEFWQIAGTEVCGGLTCIKIVGTQQTEDWDRPRADRTAWRRRDTLWVLPQVKVAQKVERIIEGRERARDQPTHRFTVRYELDSRIKYPGGLFEDRSREIARVKKLYDDADKYTRQPGVYRTQVETLLQRVTEQLERPDATHYRSAFVHLQCLLENAKKGEVPVLHANDDVYSAGAKTLTLGQRAPDFATSSITEQEPARLKTYLGKPVLLLFYNPATPTGKEVLTFAKRLSEKGEPISIMALAVTSDVEAARKQHQQMRLNFPILDGNGMRITFGVDQTPRLVLLDSNGFVRLAQTGWGAHTPAEISEELQRCQAKGR